MRSKYFRNIFHNMKANYEETIYYWYLQMCCNTEMLNWISQIHWKIFTIDWLTVSTLQSPHIPLPLGAHRGTPWPPKTPKIGWVPLGTHLESSYLPIRRGFMQKKRGKKKNFFWYPLLTHCVLRLLLSSTLSWDLDFSLTVLLSHLDGDLPNLSLMFLFLFLFLLIR